MNLKSSTRNIGGVTVVDLTGKIVIGPETAALRELMVNLLAKGDRHILLNLAHVDYIDSLGLGYLVGAYTSVKKQGGELKLLNLTTKVQDVLQITKLYTIFDVSNDEAAAVKSFNKTTSAGK